MSWLTFLAYALAGYWLSDAYMTARQIDPYAIQEDQ